MVVFLRCRDCGHVWSVAGDTADWPPCVKCGGVELELERLGAPARVDPAADPDAWKNSYDDWKTGRGEYH